MKGIHIFLADGFEETEALAPMDILKRGGLDVVLVSMNDETAVTGSRGVTLFADTTFSELKADADMEDVTSDDVLIFPGGMPGAKHLAANVELIDLMRLHFAQGGTVAAICAAPGLVASQLEGIQGRRCTCFDGFEDPLIAKGAVYVKERAVADGNLITGRGAGCSIDFGLAILAHLTDDSTVAKVKHGLMLD